MPFTYRTLVMPRAHHRVDVPLSTSWPSRSSLQLLGLCGVSAHVWWLDKVLQVRSFSSQGILLFSHETSTDVL